MAQAKELQKRFSERFDALRCAELLKKKFIPDDTTPSAKVLQLTGHCDIMIVTAVEIVEEMLQELKGGALPGSYSELKRIKFLSRNHRRRPQISYSIIEQNSLLFSISSGIHVNKLCISETPNTVQAVFLYILIK